MTLPRLSCWMTTGLLLASWQVAAHHSSAMFDDTREVTFTGKVKEFQYTNPHSWLVVEVPGKDGKIATWGFEAAGPSNLTRSGIRKGDFVPGAEITITGHPMRDGRPAALWKKATRKADGKEFTPLGGFGLQQK